ncbi:MAG: hypothetical protein B7Y80_15905 [Hyphomicrobium sp. 32-62-53]|nr:MAG: hypothetical protein B7Y80_15905 [Hyphomicrobium sp. 32-62-53]
MLLRRQPARAQGGAEGGAGLRHVGAVSDQPSSGPPAPDHGVELWIAALDDLEPLLLELDRTDPLGALAADNTGLTGARRVARSLLLRLIARRFGRAVAAQAFAIGPHGKPVLAGLDGDFNLSHTTAVDGQSFALIGLGRVAAIGVDLEPARTVRLDERRRDLIVNAALAVGDGAALPVSDEARTLQAWARLEAWGKADGRGIGRTLTHFRIWGRGQSTAASTDPDLVVYDLDAGAGLFAAVALPRGAGRPKLLSVPTDLPSLRAFLAPSGPGSNSGVDLAPGAGQKGTVRSVAQPG